MSVKQELLCEKAARLEQLWHLITVGADSGASQVEQRIDEIDLLLEGVV